MRLSAAPGTTVPMVVRRLARPRTVVVALALLAASALPAAAAAPVTGSVAGPVTSVKDKGKVFTLETPLTKSGSSTIHVGSKTTIHEQVAVKRTDLKKGVCVMAVGSRNKKGAVAATRITVSKPVKGQCTNGFGGRGNRAGRTRPGGTPRGGQGSGNSGGQRPPANGQGKRPGQGFRSGNFGFAFGTVSAAKGATLKVKDRRGTTTVTVSKKTQLDTTRIVHPAAIALKLCAFVRGTSTDTGLNVQARDISLSKPGANGCNAGGPRRP